MGVGGWVGAWLGGGGIEANIKLKNVWCSMCIYIYIYIYIYSRLTYSNWQLFEVLGYSKQFSFPLVNLPSGKPLVIRTTFLFPFRLRISESLLCVCVCAYIYIYISIYLVKEICMGTIYIYIY